jgi:hypothetical protein
LLSFAPIASPVNSDQTLAVGKANREDSDTSLPEAEIPPFTDPVGEVLRDDTLRVGKSKLRQREGNPMLRLVPIISLFIPFESGPRH